MPNRKCGMGKFWTLIVFLSILIICSSYKHSNSYFNRVEQHNKEALELLNSINYNQEDWTDVSNKNGVHVQRRYLKAGSFVSKADAMAGQKHACIKATGIIKNISPDTLFQLFLDNSRVSEYNEHCIHVKDVHYFPSKNKNSWSKLTWAVGPKYGPFKPRDFCSFVNYNKYTNGTRIVLNRPGYHDSYKPNPNKHVRATVLLAANIMEPYYDKDVGLSTKYTQIAHVNPGGATDNTAIAYIINSLCAVGPPTFIRKLEQSAIKLRNEGIIIHERKCEGGMPRGRNRGIIPRIRLPTMPNLPSIPVFKSIPSLSSPMSIPKISLPMLPAFITNRQVRQPHSQSQHDS